MDGFRYSNKSTVTQILLLSIVNHNWVDFGWVNSSVKSVDSTEATLTVTLAEYSHLNLLNLQRSWHSKAPLIHWVSSSAMYYPKQRDLSGMLNLLSFPSNASSKTVLYKSLTLYYFWKIWRLKHRASEQGKRKQPESHPCFALFVKVWSVERAIPLLLLWETFTTLNPM